MIDPGDLHPALLDEGFQQFIHGLHDVGIAGNRERSVLLDGLHGRFLDIAGHDARKRPAQIGGQFMQGLVAVQLQRRHGLMGRLERLLELQRHIERPVEEEGILFLDTLLAHQMDAAAHQFADALGIIDHDGVMRGREFAQGQLDEAVDVLEICRRSTRTGQNQRHADLTVIGVQEQTEQIQDFFGGPHAAGEGDDAVSEPYEGFQPLLDVRHDDQLVDDRIRRFGGDDARLGDADVAVVDAALFGVRDGRALHRSFHRTRSTALG